MGKSKLELLRNNLLSCKNVGLDTMCFIYQFVDHKQYAPLTNVIFELLDKKSITAVTSTITIAEVFVHPEKEKDQLVVAQYEKTFHGLPNFFIVEVDWHVARLAAKLRGIYAGIRTPDGLQMAATLLKGYSCFVTNDDRLKQVKEAKVIVLDDYL